MASCRVSRPPQPAIRSGLSVGERGLERFDPAEMRAIGAGTGGEIGMPVEQQGSALALHRRARRLDVVHPPALVGLRQAQQDRGDVGGAECLRKLMREVRRIAWGHEIETRGGAPRFGRIL
jgi:hypothetical protein